MRALGPALFVEAHDAQQLSGFAQDVLELGVLTPACGAALLFEALDEVDEGVGFRAYWRRKAAGSGGHWDAPVVAVRLSVGVHAPAGGRLPGGRRRHHAHSCER